MIREERIKKVLSEVPVTSVLVMTRAFDGTASPRKAIKAMCLSCVGHARKEITNCTGYSCPLWKYRPFQIE